MPWKSAYERAVESLEAGERLRQARLDAIGKPPPNPHAYVDFYGRTETEAMTGQQQEAPRYKDAYTREVEKLAEMDRLRLARANGEPLPEPSMVTARILAERALGPNRPEPKPQRDPRLPASAYVLANRALGRPDNFGDDGADDA